jgi:hypothetical protein
MIVPIYGMNARTVELPRIYKLAAEGLLQQRLFQQLKGDRPGLCGRACPLRQKQFCL